MKRTDTAPFLNTLVGIKVEQYFKKKSEQVQMLFYTAEVADTADDRIHTPAS